MSCWEILGIEQTADLAVIKTAYAAKAKEWHPEEHPEEFQQLQQAYHSAARYAKAQKGRSQNSGSTMTATDTAQNTFSHTESSSQKTATENILDIRLAKSAKPGEMTARDSQTEMEEAPAGTVEKSMPQMSVGECRNAGQDYGNNNTKYEFDYKSIEENALSDQFFREFFNIAWNPYLMNHLACWEYILKRSPYDQLLPKRAFRENFVRTASSLSGWQRKTLLFFERWLQSVPVAYDDSAQRNETALLCWKLKKINVYERFVSAQHCVTKEQKRLHEIFLAQVERCGRDKALTGEADIACYLSFYQPYADEKQANLKRWYRDNRQVGTLFSTVLFLLPLIAGMTIYVQVCVVPRQNTDVRQQNAQQQEEIIRYNKWLQKYEESGLQWAPEYQEELLQEAIRKQEQLSQEYEQFSESEETTDDNMQIE